MLLKNNKATYIFSIISNFVAKAYMINRSD